MTDVQTLANTLIDNIEKVIVGKSAVLRTAVTSLLGGGHLLIEDVPGVGKTMLARSMAKSVGLSFDRIQFTPDMLPSDITGVSIFNQQTREFEFRPGPIMAQIVLADEINRATPKTQAALLEAMEEKQVTVDGMTYPLDQPFMVIATQNPIEYEGTFPLPEAQLDRFFLRIDLGYPSAADEIDMLERQQRQHPIETLLQVATAEDLIAANKAIRELYVDPRVKQYIVALVEATRRSPDVYLGASPRGSLTLFRASQTLAAISGRDYVVPDDVKALAVPALAHRVIVGPAARIKDVSAANIIEEILRTVPVPGGVVTPTGR